MSLKEDIERELEALVFDRKELEERLAEVAKAIQRNSAWLEGWSAHEALLVEPPLLPAETPRQKNVKKAVMECFTECTPASWRTIASVAEWAALPQESVYHCVMREVRRGTIERSDRELTPMFRIVVPDVPQRHARRITAMPIQDGDASGLV